MRVRALLILILAIATWPVVAMAEAPARLPVAIKPPLPFPANAAGYQWVYKCPAGKRCTIYLPGQTFDLVTQAVVILVMFPVGNAIIPTYFWRVTFQSNPERTGFIQNPPSFAMTVSSELLLDASGPIGP
jgi:hypothetical protein